MVLPSFYLNLASLSRLGIFQQFSEKDAETGVAGLHHLPIEYILLHVTTVTRKQRKGQRGNGK
jgi:hypothetical protein